MIERSDTVSHQARRVVEAAFISPGLSVVTSELALCECLVRPLRNGDLELARFYVDLDRHTGMEVLPIRWPVLAGAAAARARYTTLKLPDAIHIAAAALARCTDILTCDGRWERSYSLEFGPAEQSDRASLEVRVITLGEGPSGEIDALIDPASAER